uniref:Nicotinate-nucleotide pyrophosphorylase [carboxylating] n=1 Tax=Poecilia latipinna TaxID=48699 RepID=A0A3B3VNH7_9TELE
HHAEGMLFLMVHSIPTYSLTRLAREWLAEDTPNFDPAGVCVGSEEVEAKLLCKTPHTVLAGSPFFTAVFTEVGCTVDWMYQEGAVIVTAVVRGPARCLLLGERPALNCLSRASGIATRCSQLQLTAKSAGWHGEVAGTRKTTPGFRLVEKYAMLVGGTSMHRQDLSGMVMLKDNHVWGISKLLSSRNKTLTAELSSTHFHISPLQELHVAARDLKNEFPSLQIEASGGVTPENVASYFSSHVDIISLGCITQGCPVSDFSLKVQKPGEKNNAPPLPIYS